MGPPFLPSLPPPRVLRRTVDRHQWRDGLACRRFVVVRRFCNIRSPRQQMFNFSHSWSQSPYQYRDASLNDRLPSSFLSCQHALSVRPLACPFFSLSSVSGGDRMVDISAPPARSNRSQHECNLGRRKFMLFLPFELEICKLVGGNKKIKRIFTVRHSIH